ncbi:MULTISPECIES: IclR family transcriptional regulator [unclassified Bradyrhizobium]|uniref:IclR family transcriptional regulator n=1 Tax=unclassified Bradyrhizobium TaxID=2631580 RepID=UPI00143DAF5E|nr:MULTISPECIES: IclR family transcriptional regulator [unclassified Bradyrhizobium]
MARVQVGIQSVEVGFPLLEVLSVAPGPMPLSQLAQAAHLSPSKAHRYLVSYIRIGLVEQNPLTHLYDLGGRSLALGLAAMRRLDVLTCAEPIMTEVRSELDECVSLAVWASQGPTIVRFLENSRPVNVNVRVGSRMPLLTSALGRVFLAWKEGPEISSLVKTELGTEPTRRAGLRTQKDVEALRRSIRKLGSANVVAAMFPGVSAVAVPIFDHTGQLRAAVSVVGPREMIDVSEGSAIPAAMRKAARAISARLGADPT